jgi:DedD protein
VNGSYNNDHRRQDLLEPEERDREISLGTSMILGIFFVLALLCAVFFGFGYSMGRHSAQVVAGSTDSTASVDGGGSKPSPASPVNHGVSAARQSEESAAITSDDSAPPAKAVPAAVTRAQVSNSAAAPAAAPAPANPAVRAVSLGRPVAPAAAAPAPVAVPGIGSAVVQIAAVSHQEDADVLVSALKKRGYSVAIRQVPQDKLLHVQIGPFASRKDADAMRQRLLTDGYNAIVK